MRVIAFLIGFGGIYLAATGHFLYGSVFCGIGILVTLIGQRIRVTKLTPTRLATFSVLQDKARAKLISLNISGRLSDADYLNASNRIDRLVPSAVAFGSLVALAALGKSKPIPDDTTWNGLTEDRHRVLDWNGDDDQQRTEDSYSTHNHLFDDSDFRSSHNLIDMGPTVNIDGSPMIGSIDIHGNPYGVTDDHHDILSHSHLDDSGFDDMFSNTHEDHFSSSNFNDD
jgi:hypothetical protein